MKREYRTPIAKKVCFEYEQNVVASNNNCQWGGQFTDGYRLCRDTNVPMADTKARMTCDWITPGD